MSVRSIVYVSCATAQQIVTLTLDPDTGALHEIAGHVEVRWSHGRFGGLPEAKCYLDTRHHLVPGYFPLR